MTAVQPPAALLSPNRALLTSGSKVRAASVSQGTGRALLPVRHRRPQNGTGHPLPGVGPNGEPSHNGTSRLPTRPALKSLGHPHRSRQVPPGPRRSPARLALRGGLGSLSGGARKLLGGSLQCASTAPTTGRRGDTSPQGPVCALTNPGASARWTWLSGALTWKRHK